jgi:hypothetical protein
VSVEHGDARLGERSDEGGEFGRLVAVLGRLLRGPFELDIALLGGGDQSLDGFGVVLDYLDNFKRSNASDARGEFPT